MTTREEWLNSAAVRLNEMIGEKTALKPSKKVLVSTGWPRRDRGGKVIGQCFIKAASNGTHHIFISPLLGTADEVLHVLLHELIHAADDCQSKHGGAFTRAARACGLEGKPTATVAGAELGKELKVLAKELGKYPHSKLSAAELPKPQTTRMLLCECIECGCKVRMTRKWLDEAGAPTCGCGARMEEA